MCVYNYNFICYLFDHVDIHNFSILILYFLDFSNDICLSTFSRVIGKYIRQTQNKLQISSLSKQEKSPNEEKNLPLLEKMMIQRIHPNDISILLMDMIILGVQAVILNNLT